MGSPEPESGKAKLASYVVLYTILRLCVKAGPVGGITYPRDHILGQERFTPIHAFALFIKYTNFGKDI